MARLGMEVDVVERAGGQLKAKAQDLQGLIGNIEAIVSELRSNWDGQDAQVFVNDWWPKHKGALQSAAQQIEGLGQSALANASAQRDISGH